jgi:hypothetical protein
MEVWVGTPYSTEWVLKSEYGMVWFGFWGGCLLDESVSVSGFAEPEMVQMQMPR